MRKNVNTNLEERMPLWKKIIEDSRNNILSGHACFNYKIINQKKYPSPYIFIDLKIKNIDITIVHEMNHQKEMDYDFNSMGYFNAWSYLNLTDYKHSVEKYDQMSENINDLIAEDIYQLMIEKGITIFNDQQENKSLYSYGFWLTKEFFNQFKPIILESRRLHDINIIYNAVGENNFNELNELVKKYMDGEISPEGLQQKDEILMYLDEILNNMQLYYNQHRKGNVI